MLEQVFHQTDGLGVIIAVCDSLVDRHAEVDAVTHLEGAVVIEERTRLAFTDDDEHRGRAPI